MDEKDKQWVVQESARLARLAVERQELNRARRGYLELRSTLGGEVKPDDSIKAYLQPFGQACALGALFYGRLGLVEEPNPRAMRVGTAPQEVWRSGGMDWFRPGWWFLAERLLDVLTVRQLQWMECLYEGNAAGYGELEDEALIEAVRTLTRLAPDPMDRLRHVLIVLEQKGVNAWA